MNTLNLFDGLLLAAAETARPTITTTDWWLTVAGAALLLAGLAATRYLTRSGIIARATAKEAVRQPIFVLLLVLGLGVLILNTYLPFFSLGEDLKMFKDCGLATLLISGLLLGIWTSSTSVADEIEGKTAMTLLSKPINRQQFVLGKYLGILQGVLMLLVPLSLCFLVLIYYKVGFDAPQVSRTPPPGFVLLQLDWLPVPLPWFEPTRAAAVTQVLPGVALIFLETAILTALSVAISTRLPMVVNMVTCFTIFVIAHMTPVLVKSTFQGLEPVKFVAQLIATVLPALEVFNMQAAVATGQTVPPVYLGFSTLYCLLYVGVAILLAFILFEDRDLA